MDEIILKDFRCFHEEQTARLAPLTILVGDNSTGKTSFLAVIRSLWDACYKQQTPNFKDEPYDLGSFREIAHHRGAGGSRAAAFEAEFRTNKNFHRIDGKGLMDYGFRMEIGERRTIPTLLSRSIESSQGVNITEVFDKDGARKIRFTTPNGTWETAPSQSIFFQQMSEKAVLPIVGPLFVEISEWFNPSKKADILRPCGHSRQASQADKNMLEETLFHFPFLGERPFASAPVRSRPKRTYDPASPEQDAEGDYIPMYFADVRNRSVAEWDKLKEHLEKFGKSSGLFDEIAIKRLGRKESEPFQVQVRKYSGRGKKVAKGPFRNLIDVGYGISQVLPVIAELLRKDSDSMCLLQQPEVHLHPSAQAALGDFFCEVASQRGRQLVIETHSDYLLDRIRMAIRFGTTKLKPEDVSILFFERQGLSVKIRSLRLDEQGSITNAPAIYRKFFMEEEYRRLRGFGDVRDT